MATGVRQAVGEVHSGAAYRLALFGSFTLTGPDGQPINGLSRKARGLIAYLALTRGGVDREHLAELLWGDRGAEQARASLRQAGYELRQALPTEPPLLVLERDRISLCGEHVTTDVDGLSDAEMASTLDPLRRDLLRDLNALSPAFDHWLTVERRRRANERRDGTLRIAREAFDARRWAKAKSLARALMALDATDQDAVEIALRAMGRLNEEREARKLFDEHAKALRKELDVEPAVSHIALIEEIDGRSRIARNSFQRRLTHDRLFDRFLPPGAPGKGAGLGTGRAVGVAIAAFVVIAGAIALTFSDFGGAPVAPAVPVVEVAALATAPGDDAARDISAALRSSIVRHLAGSRTPIRIVDAAPASGAPATLMVRGNSASDRGRVRANIELVALPSRQVIWAGTFERPLAEQDQFEEQLSLQIARELHFAHADGRGPYFDRDPEFARLSLAHYDVLGRDFPESARLARQVVERIPSFARSWSEYAVDTALASEDLSSPLRAAGYREAIAYAHRALAMDPHQGLAYAALIQATEDGRWAERERLARQGEMADPTNPEIHSWRAGNLAIIGRLNDAYREVMLAYQYDHFLPGKVAEIGWLQVLSGSLGDAEDTLGVGQTYWPHHPWFDNLTVGLAIAGKKPAETLQRITTDQLPVDDQRKAMVSAFLRWRAEPTPANKLKAEQVIETRARTETVTHEEIRLLAMLGRLDSAFRLADRLPGGDSQDGDWFGVDLVAFRHDPRFMRFAARVGLAQIWQETDLWPDFCQDEGGISACKAAARAAMATVASRKPAPPVAAG